MKSETNIDFINEILKFIVEKLNNKKLNYYIVGAIGAYIDAELPLQRNHEDIDILIEEKNISDLEKLFKNTDFKFFDNRFISDKVLNEHGYTDGFHEVYAQYKNSDFHIGFFLYHYNETSYTLTEYFRENDIQKKLERTLPIEFFNAQYNNNIKDYFGLKLKVIRKETIYKNKMVMNREKDLFDIEILKPKIDNEKLNKLKGLSKYRVSTIIEL